MRLGTDSPSRFSLAPLRPAQDAHLHRLGRTLLKQAILECETTLQEMDQHWKHMRTQNGIKVYKAKSQHAPAEIMTTGIIKATVSEIMQCLYSDNTFNFRMNSALLMPKEHLDCEVLHALDVQDEDHPYRFNGLKWCATKWPGGSMGKARDMCYFESTGMTQTNDKAGDPLEYGYCFMESYDLAQCPKLDAFSIVRAKISIRHIFRELPMGVTVVMTHSTVDPCGALASWINHASVPPHVMAIAMASECAESIRLSNHMRQQSSSGLTVYQRPRNWGKLSFLINRHPTCTLCHEEDHHLQRRRVVEIEGIGIKTSRQLFCSSCINARTTTPTLDVDFDYCSPMPDFTISSRSSLGVSGYASSSSSDSPKSRSSSIHMLELDDDELDELSYSGLGMNPINSCDTLSRRGDQAFHSETESSNGSNYSPRDDCCHLHNSSTALAGELARLTNQMDHIWGIVRRNKTQADYFKGYNRIEYL